jgi:hypothetical protein
VQRLWHCFFSNCTALHICSTASFLLWTEFSRATCLNAGKGKFKLTYGGASQKFGVAKKKFLLTL